MLFSSVIDEDSLFNENSKNLYYMIPSQVVPDEVGIGIGTEVDSEDFLAENPIFGQARVSENETSTIIPKLNANDANKENGVTWEPIEEKIYSGSDSEISYTIPGFKLQK